MAVKVLTSVPDVLPRISLQMTAHASVCARMLALAGPHDVKKLAKVAGEWTACSMFAPLLSNTSYTHCVIWRLRLPADTVTPSAQLGVKPPHTSAVDTAGFGSSVAVGAIRSWTPTASHACVIARSAALPLPYRSRAAWIVVSRVSAYVAFDGSST